MAARTRKPKAPESLVWEGELAKETTGTYQYKEVGEREDQISGSLYVKKGPLEGFGENIPQNIRVTIEFL